MPERHGTYHCGTVPILKADIEQHELQANHVRRQNSTLSLASKMAMGRAVSEEEGEEEEPARGGEPPRRTTIYSRGLWKKPSRTDRSEGHGEPAGHQQRAD